MPKAQHMWHRLSVHVKTNETACNQTAVIKPLTKSYQGSGKSLTFSDTSKRSLLPLSVSCWGGGEDPGGLPYPRAHHQVPV